MEENDKNAIRIVVIKYSEDKSEWPQKILEHFSQTYEYIIENSLRSYSIYHYMKLSIGSNSKVTRDYYDLTLIHLRKLFEKPMKNAFNETEIVKIRDYQISFCTWINDFVATFSKIDLSNDIWYENNVHFIKKNINASIKVLKEFIKIYSYNDINIDGFNTYHPLKTRIIEYASKFVAHNIRADRIEEWEYSDEIFVKDCELENLSSILLNILIKYRNLMYYWNNVVKMPEFDYNISLEDYMKNCYHTYLEDINGICKLDM